MKQSDKASGYWGITTLTLSVAVLCTMEFAITSCCHEKQKPTEYDAYIATILHTCLHKKKVKINFPAFFGNEFESNLKRHYLQCAPNAF